MRIFYKRKKSAAHFLHFSCCLPACLQRRRCMYRPVCLTVVRVFLFCVDLCLGFLFFIEEQCFTAYSSSRGLISLQSLDGLCKPGAFSCTIYSCETGLRSWCLHHENTVLYSHWRLQGLSSGRAHTQTHTALTAIHLPCRGRQQLHLLDSRFALENVLFAIKLLHREVTLCLLSSVCGGFGPSGKQLVQ